MKKYLFMFLFFLFLNDSFAYIVLSTKELGKDDAKNQNIIVKCTTDMGDISNEVCSIRRYVKCKNDKCDEWQPWQNLKDSSYEYSDWREAAVECCLSYGLR